MLALLGLFGESGVWGTTCWVLLSSKLVWVLLEEESAKYILRIAALSFELCLIVGVSGFLPLTDPSLCPQGIAST